MIINTFNVNNKYKFMNFTLHQLNIFLSVAEYRSMTRAAKALHMTQPAVSIQMKQLQEAVDIPLVNIVGKKLYLTEAGEEFHRFCIRLSEGKEHFEATASQLKGGLKGKLTVSAASTAKYYLPYLLGEFQKRFPKIEISLKVTNRNEVLSHLQENQYSIAILTQVPDDDTIESIPFLENPLLMASHPAHPLSGKKINSLKKLGDEHFIFREKGSGTRMVMESLFQKAGIDPRITMELGTNEAVKQAIMAGIGISMISELSLITEKALNKIDSIDISNFPVTTYWHILYKKEKLLSPVTQNFINFLTEPGIKKYLP